MRRAATWTPSALMMAGLFYSSSLSDPGAPGGVSDKALHMLAYGALGAALLFALADGRIAGVTLRAAALAGVLGAAYGITDELHQYVVPNRTFEVMDLLADAAGAALGSGALYAFTAAATSKRRLEAAVRRRGSRP